LLHVRSRASTPVGQVFEHSVGDRRLGRRLPGTLHRRAGENDRETSKTQADSEAMGDHIETIGCGQDAGPARAARRAYLTDVRALAVPLQGVFDAAK
jgi:hypothetical protein